MNARGELIGINTFLISSRDHSGNGICHSGADRPADGRNVIRDGKVTHGFIGIQIADVTPDNAKFFQMKKAEGALVSQVQADAPGAKRASNR